MKIEANDKEVQDIFSLGYFKIPRFQRPYSWGNDEVESFWKDTIIENSENYFIGSMVVYQNKKPYFGIVDGQQRLTTITLILSAIRNAFISIGETNLAKGVHKYVEKANIDNEDEFILNSETAYPYLQDHIQSFNGINLSCDVGVEEKKLESAFSTISRLLDKYIPAIKDNSGQASLFTDHENSAVQKLKAIRDKVLSLKLVFIQLENEDDAYLIFETLNARGRDLTTSDLVKNLLLKNKKSTSKSIDQAKESWNSMVKHFDDEADSSTLDSFLLHYWVSKHSYTTDKKLFPEIKKMINDEPSEAHKLLLDLSSYSSTYRDLLAPEQRKWSKEELPVKNSLLSLNTFKVKQQTALTLALLQKYEKKSISLRVLKKSLNKIEKFHYCFNAITSQRSSGSVASNYSKIAIDLTNADTQPKIQSTLKNLDTFLKSKMPELNEFKVKFKEMQYGNKKTKDKKIVKYTLDLLTPKNNAGLTIDSNSLTIEHLHPQSKPTTDINEESIYNIGNLILLDNKTNSNDLEDKTVKEKISILKGLNFPLQDIALSEVEWNKMAIESRADLMAEKIYAMCIEAVQRQ
ncbi:DUF262 domain-containing protein [Oceanospirillum sanctuarii]|uniref:DUF262 domain-containing protein n=1 Tax=Oceanospirillum sanctuarii TaxID=1434821 RepID=UPI000A3CDAB7|nr:DUF262 domain-containing protein [Oceanospirillum sanctuarii]